MIPDERPVKDAPKLDRLNELQPLVESKLVEVAKLLDDGTFRSHDELLLVGVSLLVGIISGKCGGMDDETMGAVTDKVFTTALNIIDGLMIVKDGI